MEKDLDDQVSVKMENGQSGGKADPGGEYSKTVLISVAIQTIFKPLCVISALQMTNIPKVTRGL